MIQGVACTKESPYIYFQKKDILKGLQVEQEEEKQGDKNIKNNFKIPTPGASFTCYARTCSKLMILLIKTT